MISYVLLLLFHADRTPRRESAGDFNASACDRTVGRRNNRRIV